MSTSVSRMAAASPEAVFKFFLDADAVAAWLPPGEMTCVVHAFDAREGGVFRMSLVYPDTDGEGLGKTSANTDTVAGRFVELVPHARIVWACAFDSDDPSFAGEMLITWTFAPAAGGTLVTVSCDDAPEGIRPEDHEAGFRSTLEKLAAFVAAAAAR